MQLTNFSTSNYNLFTLFIVILVLINNHEISANSLSSKSNHQIHTPYYNDLSYEDNDENESPILINPNNLYIPDNEELIKQNPWSKVFHRYTQRSMNAPRYYSASLPAFNLRNGEIRFISYPAQKRAIPIEFQKALFAHGIVGRRR